MTRQTISQSPSQGALMCAGGGGEEGWRAAGPSSSDPAPHSGVWTRGWALPSFGGSRSCRQSCACGGQRSPPLGPGNGPDGPAGSPLLVTGAGGAPSSPGGRVRVAAAGEAGGEQARAGELPTPRLGSWAGVSVAELVCSLFFNPEELETLSLTQRALAVLKLPGRGRGGSWGLNHRGLWPS